MVPDQTLPAHARAEMCMQHIVFLVQTAACADAYTITQAYVTSNFSAN